MASTSDGREIISTASSCGPPFVLLGVGELGFLDRVARPPTAAAMSLAAAGYDDDLVLYDVVGPFVRRGEDPTNRLEKWIASYRTGIGHEIRDLEIIAGADLAFCHFLVRISGTTRDGTEVGRWVRATPDFTTAQRLSNVVTAELGPLA